MHAFTNLNRINHHHQQPKSTRTFPNHRKLTTMSSSTARKFIQEAVSSDKKCHHLLQKLLPLLSRNQGPIFFPAVQIHRRCRLRNRYNEERSRDSKRTFDHDGSKSSAICFRQRPESWRKRRKSTSIPKWCVGQYA